MAKRDILTKRIEGGWASKDGRIRAVRVSEQEWRDAVKRGDAAYLGSGRRDHWEVQMLDADMVTVIEEDTADTLTEADDMVWWWADRIAVGDA